MASITTQLGPGHCVDEDGRVISDGDEFIPDDDPCKTCHCQNSAIMCRSVQCSPPQCQYQQVIGECCKFICTDGTDIHQTPTAISDPAPLGVRMIATAVTSLLIFALLVFMIHRLRRRHILLHSRRQRENERREELEEDEYMAYVTNIDQVDLDFPSYETEPPPPYTPRKPSHDIQTDEAPPPYQAQTNGALPSSDQSRERSDEVDQRMIGCAGAANRERDNNWNDLSEQEGSVQSRTVNKTVLDGEEIAESFRDHCTVAVRTPACSTGNLAPQVDRVPASHTDRQLDDIKVMRKFYNPTNCAHPLEIH